VSKTRHPPFQPIRDKLYSSRELMEGFDATDPLSMMKSVDFKSFVYFVVNGRAAPEDPYAGMMQALHDNSILRAMWAHLDGVGRPVSAIMGGHREDRGSPTYVEVTRIAKRLTEAGFLMASGGGPGCMEATHLGALLAGREDAEIERAVEPLRQVLHLPDSRDMVASDGTIKEEIVKEIHAWAAPAVEILDRYEKGGGESLAVPTWHYGHEPISPLATHVAKYFLNSIREDVLLALASNGIIFSPGRAGTLQEVFQDAAQNYYDPMFAPMVFWDKRFWTDDLPVGPLLEGLFVKLKKMTPEQFKAKVLITSDLDEAVAFILGSQPSKEAVAERFASLGFNTFLRAL
jgi:predicted Rossmann-fold nucleotide-binding protein